MSGEGYKVLLDYVASSRTPLRCLEIPYNFRRRVRGTSKVDEVAIVEYGLLLADKLLRGAIPPRFLLFACVGGTGVLVHLSVLTVLFNAAQISFDLAQAMATVVAMTTNFTLNNLLTYRDVRLRGWNWWRGLITFYLICGIGAAANVGIATALFDRRYSWWLSATAGILVGTVFNFATTSIFTWKRR